MIPKRFWILIMASILILATGCSGGSSLNQATTTAQAVRYQGLATQMSWTHSSTQVATSKQAAATASAIITQYQTASVWPVTLEDRFNDNALNWPLEPDLGELTDTYFRMEEGQFRFDSLAKGAYVYWTIPDSSDAADFLLSVRCQKMTGDVDGSCGLVYRLVDEENYYIFRVDDTGYFGLDKLENGDWVALLDWTESAAILPGEFNLIEVLAIGSGFSFRINGEQVGSSQDGSFSQGSTGIVIEMYQEGQQGIFAFDDFTLRAAP